jgi:tryptophan synthase alpha chain
MSRIKTLFDNKRRKVLNVYCTAGFPELDSTLRVVKALETAGVDMVELGIPYSDPLADGPVIQASSTKALQNGMTLSRLFDQLKELRKETNIPVILMGYMNPVLQFGFERFCRMAAESGIDGLILPDLPVFEYENEYGAIIKKYGLDFIFLVTPETATERIKKLDALSSGFLYAVSSSSTTGSGTASFDKNGYLEKLQGLGLQNPLLVGFGIRDKPSFEKAADYASGAIIGSAYINAISGPGDLETRTKAFISSIRD